MVEALTPCTKQPQKQDVRFRQTTAAMLEVLTYTPSIAEVDKADFCVKKCEGTCREDRTTHQLRTSRPNTESAQHTSSLAFSYTSAMQSYFKITNLLCEWHAGFCGGYFSPSACKKQKSLVHPLSPCYLVYLRYTKTPNCLCVVLILYLVWMCAGGASSCPPYKCLRTFLHKSLLYLPQVYETLR